MGVAETVEQKTKQSKTNFYYSFLFLPEVKRRAMFTVYSFCRHTDDIVDEIEDKDEARRVLDDWRRQLDQCYEGDAKDPILIGLQEINQHFNLPKEYFQLLIQGCEMDLTQKRYSTFDELYQYCYHVASVVGLICIEIFGYRTEQAKEYAVNLGMALQLTNIMRDVGEDARNGRIYLPAEDLERFQYSEEKLMNEIYCDEFVALMRCQEQRAADYYQKARALYDRRDHPMLFPAEIMGKIYHSLLVRIVAADFNVYQQRIRVPNSRKMAIALREWMSARVQGAFQWS